MRAAPDCYYCGTPTDPADPGALAVAGVMADRPGTIAPDRDVSAIAAAWVAFSDAVAAGVTAWSTGPDVPTYGPEDDDTDRLRDYVAWLRGARRPATVTDGRAEVVYVAPRVDYTPNTHNMYANTMAGLARDATRDTRAVAKARRRAARKGRRGGRT